MLNMNFYMIKLENSNLEIIDTEIKDS